MLTHDSPSQYPDGCQESLDASVSVPRRGLGMTTNSEFEKIIDDALKLLEDVPVDGEDQPSVQSQEQGGGSSQNDDESGGRDEAGGDGSGQSDQQSDGGTDGGGDERKDRSDMEGRASGIDESQIEDMKLVWDAFRSGHLVLKKDLERQQAAVERDGDRIPFDEAQQLVVYDEKLKKFVPQDRDDELSRKAAKQLNEGLQVAGRLRRLEVENPRAYLEALGLPVSRLLEIAERWDDLQEMLHSRMQMEEQRNMLREAIAKHQSLLRDESGRVDKDRVEEYRKHFKNLVKDGMAPAKAADYAAKMLSGPSKRQEPQRKSQAKSRTNGRLEAATKTQPQPIEPQSEDPESIMQDAIRSVQRRLGLKF